MSEICFHTQDARLISDYIALLGLLLNRAERLGVRSGHSELFGVLSAFLAEMEPADARRER